MKKTLALILVALMMLSLTGTMFAAGEEIVDGKFVTPRQITVEIYDRANDGGSKPEDNFYTNFIKEGMLRDHNVEVTFVPVPRWTETEQINNLLAAGTAPDICVTYSYPTIYTYAQMGGVTNMTPYLEENKDLLPNLWALLGDENIYWTQDPETKELWAIEAKLIVNRRTNTFVREDWLKKLELAAPTTMEEFEAVLNAFQDNAELLLGADADKMIPFSLSFDIGWRADHLLTSFVPNDIDEREMFIRGFDDRRLLWPNYKEGVRKLNQWYNEGLIWKDFPLYPAGDSTEDNLLKAGYVGAFAHNWDYPYRNFDQGVHYSLQTLVGEEAAYVAVEPFQNDGGAYRKYLSAPVDRKVFFPATNDEPVASLMYLDWISKFENRNFLQIGEAGVTHELQEDGSVRTIGVTGEKIMNSPNNIDYTITANGLEMADLETSVKSIANGYAGVDKRFIEVAYEIGGRDAYIGKNYNVGEIKAEEGMGPALKEKRDAFLNQAVIAKPEDFDAVYDAGMQDYLASGGQAIIDERTEKYDAMYK